MLFVLEGDLTAVGEHVDFSDQHHVRLMDAARKADAPFPFVRRINDYYRDVTFEHDEVAGLIDELRPLAAAVGESELEGLLGLCRAALDAGVGVEVIAD